MQHGWDQVLWIIYPFILMFIAKFIKEKLRIFRSIIIPTALLAGFMGLIIGPGVLKLIDFNYDFYENVVFHFMAIGFITLTLTESKTKKEVESTTYGLVCVSTYLFQALIGLGVAFVLVMFIKDLFPGLGIMLPLAFGQGPGFANNIGGANWEDIVSYAGQYGLSLATIGFLWGGLVGVILLNIYVRKHKIRKHKLNELDGMENIKSLNLEVKTPKEVNFFDMLTVQLTFVGIIYLLSYGAMEFIASYLEPLGDIGNSLADSVKGFNFIFGIIFAIGLRQINKYWRKKKQRERTLINSYMMSNISSLSFNLMICASVMAIQIELIKDYWVLLITISTVGGIFTLLYVLFIVKRVYRGHFVEHILALYGTFTGTASTGLALLRGIDPDLESGVAEELAIGSAIALPLAFPLIILISVQLKSFDPVTMTTVEPKYNWIVIGVFLGYFLFLQIIMLLRKRRYNKRINNI